MSGDLAHVLADRAAIRWGDLRQRVLSALILGPLALLCLWLGGVPYVIWIGLGAIGGLLEWIRMCGSGLLDAPALTLATAVLAGMASSVAGLPGTGLVLLAAGAALTFALARLAGRAGTIAAGAPYLGLAGIALMWLRADPAAGRADIIFLAIAVWGSDIGAYAVGRLVGGPKLAPRISPGKTWSGAVGGLLGACVSCLVLVQLFPGPADPLRVAAVAACLALVAQAGDLLESQMKRHFGVKDSGTTIPGHGGLLDRLDGLLTAAPVAALLALALGRGVVLWQ